MQTVNESMVKLTITLACLTLYKHTHPTKQKSADSRLDQCDTAAVLTSFIFILPELHFQNKGTSLANVIYPTEINTALIKRTYEMKKHGQQQIIYVCWTILKVIYIRHLYYLKFSFTFVLL